MLIRGANPIRLFAAAALLGAYGFWLFTAQSPWTRAQGAAGPAMPELIAGFPGDAIIATLERLGDRRDDYLWAQAFDLALAALIIIVAVSAIGLALRSLRSLRLAHGDLRYALLAPVFYGVLELGENALLAGFASGALAPGPAFIFVQQSLTTLKLAALLLTGVVSLAACAVWAIAAFASLQRRVL
ncbi:MAG: hypothetical protein HXY21_13660 [Parvularculaceae bacterium]|nr:hypothetical protein [Parvularculaceae bacterium]